MKRKPSIEFLLTVLAVLAIGYLLLWPVPVKPIGWEAPEDAGLVGDFAPNDTLAAVRTLSIEPHSAPEDVAIGPDGLVYASVEDGHIVRLGKDGDGLELFAEVGGRPLGIEFDADGNLLIANAMLGLQMVRPDGQVETLFDSLGGEPLAFANDLAIADSGLVYLTESSTKFGAADWGGTYAASLLDIMEHGGYGRLYQYDPATGAGRLLLVGLNFANGVAISADQEHLLIAETGHYRIWRYWLAGKRKDRFEVVADNLPGFPDNINRGLDGRYWVGLVAPRNALLDGLADKPFLRAAVQRLPAALRPKAAPSTHLIAIDSQGRVLANLQDRAAGFRGVTGAVETGDAMFLSSLFESRIAVLPRSELSP